MSRNEEQQFDELVDRMKSGHHTPPETPRDRMWERIAAARAEQREEPQVVRPEFGFRHGGSSQWWRLAAAAAAILVLGIGVGRMLPGGGEAPVPIAEAPVPAVAAPQPGKPAPDAYFQLAAVDLFGRADALLTGFRTETCDSSDLAPVPGWAGEMLVRTRLLLGAAKASGAEGSSLYPLLLELEMVLVQISGLSGEDCRQETEWIRDGLQKRSTVERLRLMASTGNPTPL